GPAPSLGGMSMSAPSAPSLSAPTMPHASLPIPGTIQGDTLERQRLMATGSGIHQIQNPVLRGIAGTADTIGRIFLPGLERAIPGGEGHHQSLLGQNQTNINNDLAIGQKEAQTANLNAQPELKEQAAELNQAKLDEKTRHDTQTADAALRREGYKLGPDGKP